MVSHRSGSFLQHSQVSVSRIIFNLFLSQSLTRAEALIRSTEKTSLSSATQRAELLEVSLRLLISRMTCPLSNWGQDRYPRCACEIPAFHFCRAFTSPSFKQSLEVVICESSKKGRPFPTTQHGEGCKHLPNTKYVHGPVENTAWTPVSVSPSSLLSIYKLRTRFRRSECILAYDSSGEDDVLYDV